MATFVLVHGGWHGGWCWKKVPPLLRAAGHAVHTPTLTGLGERAHLAHPDIGLETHIRDIVAVLDCEDLRDVILVGHSYAGAVITGVADRCAGRLAQLVYLDAFVPGDAQACLDFVTPEFRANVQRQAEEHDDGWRVPSPDPGYWGVTDAADVQWMVERLAPQPLRTLVEPLRLQNPPPAIPHTYLLCLPARTFGPIGARAKAEPGWRYREVHSGHDAMITVPEEVADELLALA